MLKRIFRISAVGFLLILPLSTQSSEIEIDQVVQRIDALYRSQTSYASIEMEVVNPHWQRILHLEAWTKGMKQTFIRILAPPKEKNLATLRIGNEMWNYLPNANKVIKIPPSMMMNAWMGSDFTNDDLVKESSMLEDYHYSFVEPPDTQPHTLYLEFIPKEDSPIVWARTIIAVRDQDYIPLWQKYYNDRDDLIRVLEFKEIKRFNDRSIPSVLEMTTVDKAGQKTIIRYLDIKFDLPLKESVFSLRNLQSKE